MLVNTITEAKARLSELIERVQEGEEVVINKAGKPVAVLRAYGKYSAGRASGTLKGKIRIAADFDELPEDVAKALGVV